MKRDIDAFCGETFDLLIVGAGIVGAFAAWDAALRGLSVALLERGDFGGATSANSLKIIHGGLRYLPSGNLRRMRESIRERSTLLRLAPNLVRPLPVLIPTYGLASRSRYALRLALAANDWISFDRNRDIEEGRAIPCGRLIDRNECLRLFPHFDARHTTGGAIWHDCQVCEPERLTLALLQAAVGVGARVINYVEARELLIRSHAVHGVRAVDRVGSREFDVRARTVLNATGPWVDDLLNSARGDRLHVKAQTPVALAYNLVCRRPLLGVAVAVRSRRNQSRDPVCGGHRHIFLTPWRNSTLVGTAYVPVRQGADRTVSRPTLSELEDLVTDVNEACHGLDLSLDDVSFFNSGFVPLTSKTKRRQTGTLAEKPRVVDHAQTDGITGLVSAAAVKFTTARRVAEVAIGHVFYQLGHAPPPCSTARRPLPKYAAETAVLTCSSERADDVMQVLTRAVREEMAVTLEDVVFRRTQLGTEGPPSREWLTQAAGLMAQELGWDAQRVAQEIDQVTARYAPLEVAPRRTPRVDTTSPVDPVSESHAPAR